MKNSKFLIIFLALIIMSCSKDEGDRTTLTIASEKGTCNIVDEFSCYIVKYEGFDYWTTMPDFIEGFDYEAGYEYVIEIKRVKIKNPPMDYRGKYKLLKVISKIRKQSEGLPNV